MCLSPWMGVWQTRAMILVYLVLAAPAASAGIYRWQDSSGNTYYGDTPPAAAHKLQRLSPTAYDSYGQVATVLDGDTLVLTDGRRVRLLGIDAPEVAHHNLPGEPLGEEARLFLKAHAEGKQVQLRYDLQHEDRYHRVLAHVFLDDAQNLNALLLHKGLAYARFEWPNLQNADRYYDIESMARSQSRGIWKLPAYQIKSLENLAALRNRFVRLRGRVARIEKKRSYIYLLFGDKLRVAVKHSRLRLFREAGLDLNALARRTVVLRGWLGQRDGSPYLKLSHPFQLEQVQ